ncbi:MAG: carboxypeptidase regulatory-like domain-containing protein [Acidobacteria bacterium]|nr:carboxypeptidase regulatory-like domain-containing protein [Acidobacteriota bacterium]
MNESIFLRYIRDGKMVPVTKFVSGRGIELAGESSASLIKVRFGMSPADPVTRTVLKNVLPMLGMQSLEEYRVTPVVANGGIRLTGIRPDITSLPPGTYDIRIELDDLKLERLDTVTVKKGKETVVDVTEKIEKKVFTLIDDPAFEPSIFSILSNAASVIDGMPATAWLKDPLRRARRKACLLNLMAKLRHIKEGGVSLTQHVTSVTQAEIDRIYT